jgi:hypothetical protein
LNIDGDARVFLDGQRVDPGQFSESVLTIDGPGSATDYRISVSGDLEKTTANDASINPDDDVSGSTAAGYVVAGRDSYKFSAASPGSSLTLAPVLYSIAPTKRSRSTEQAPEPPTPSA